MIAAAAGRDDAAAEPFGRLTRVRKAFAGASGAGGEVVALDEVSYDLRRGELVSLLGPSGCGKTTLLRIVAGMTRASGGRVEMRGREVVAPQEDFGFVFQSPTLLPWRSVLGNVLFPMEILGCSDAAARAPRGSSCSTSSASADSRAIVRINCRAA